MAQYLHIRVEDIDLLLPALQVHEVISLERLQRQADGHAIWRDQVIAVFDLGQLMQRTTSSPERPFGVVYSPDASNNPPVLMLMDEVLGLRHTQHTQLHRLPGAVSQAHQWFDALWIDPQHPTKAYRLREQLPPEFLNIPPSL